MRHLYSDVPYNKSSSTHAYYITLEINKFKQDLDQLKSKYYLHLLLGPFMVYGIGYGIHSIIFKNSQEAKLLSFIGIYNSFGFYENIVISIVSSVVLVWLNVSHRSSLQSHQQNLKRLKTLYTWVTQDGAESTYDSVVIHLTHTLAPYVGNTRFFDITYTGKKSSIHFDYILEHPPHFRVCNYPLLSERDEDKHELERKRFRRDLKLRAEVLSRYGLFSKLKAAFTVSAFGDGTVPPSVNRYYV